MSSDAHRDRVIDEVTEKVMQRPAINADEDVVRAKAAESVDDLLDTPIQTFTSVLAENAVLSDLHGQPADSDAADE